MDLGSMGKWGLAASTGGLAGVAGYSGYLKGKRNEQRMRENAAYRKAVLQYSPWTGMQDPGAGPDMPGKWESAIDSGLKAALVGAQVGGAMATGNPALAAGAVSTASSMGSQPNYANALGGQDMAAQLGSSYAGMQPQGGLESQMGAISQQPMDQSYSQELQMMGSRPRKFSLLQQELGGYGY